MYRNFPAEAQEIMADRFGCDTLIALATTDGLTPSVRTVNSYYEDGAFYVITHAASNKMLQMNKNPNVAICADWFTAHGVAENLGHVLKDENADMLDKLRVVFAEWYGNGDVNESDENMILLHIRLTDGVLFSHGTKFDIDFTHF